MRPDYVATGIFFMWIAFSIFRWVARTAADVEDVPASITRLEEEVLQQAAMRSGRRLREDNF